MDAYNVTGQVLGPDWYACSLVSMQPWWAQQRPLSSTLLCKSLGGVDTHKSFMLGHKIGR